MAIWQKRRWQEIRRELSWSSGGEWKAVAPKRNGGLEAGGLTVTATMELLTEQWRDEVDRGHSYCGKGP